MTVDKERREETAQNEISNLRGKKEMNKYEEEKGKRRKKKQRKRRK